MEKDDAAVLTLHVEATQRLLDNADANDGTHDDIRLQQLLLELEQDITRFGSQRVLVLDGSQLMDLGVVLYNSARNALKQMTTDNSVFEAASAVVVTKYSRYSVVMARFLAAKLMGLSLTCSRNGSRSDNNAVKKTQYLDECIDVFRSFGRVGGLMLESAKSDADKCQQYLALAHDAFENCNRIWSQIGLSHLTKIKKDMELEEILEDLWDFGMDRIRVLRLHRNDVGVDVRNIVEAVHELHMLLPYMTSYIGDFTKLLNEISNDYRHSGMHEEQETFTRDILRICGSFENDVSNNLFLQTKQSLLLNLLESFTSKNAVEKADETFDLLPNKNDAVGLLTMSKLYVTSKLFDKALQVLRTLFQQNDLNLSIQGARAYAQALSFNDQALKIYQELERNYGDNSIEISLDLIRNLAVSEAETHKKLAISELKRIAIHIRELESDDNEIKAIQTGQIHRIIFEATQSTYTISAYSDCIEWSKLGLTLATVEQEAAFYMRMLAMSSLKMGAQNDAIKWAEDAVATDLSKRSLYIQFQVLLEVEETTSDNISHSTIKNLKERDDFEVQDLVAFAKAASIFENKEDVVWSILDEVCSLVAKISTVDKTFPVGILLQNTAQLAYKCITQMKLNHGTTKDPAEAYADKFLMYTKILLESCHRGKQDAAIFPQSVFDWFYSMSFNIAKNIDRPDFFLLGADIAKQASLLHFGEDPCFSQRQTQCLLAAICSEMRCIESLERQKLRDLLDLIDRFERETFDEDSGVELREFLAKSVVTIKLRLFDSNTNGLFQMCQARISRNADSFIDLGELVLYSTKFDEATEVRSKYRNLASDLFKYSLQLMLQNDTISPSKLSYVFRRLISLTETKLNAYEWFEQLVQVTESLGVNLPATETEWFVGKSWNIGISYLRNDDRAEATKFMKISLTILEKCEQLSIQLGDILQDQYQHFISV